MDINGGKVSYGDTAKCLEQVVDAYWIWPFPDTCLAWISCCLSDQKVIQVMLHGGVGAIIQWSCKLNCTLFVDDSRLPLWPEDVWKVTEEAVTISANWIIFSQSYAISGIFQKTMGGIE